LKNKEYKECQRKINNLLENCEGDLHLTELKVKVNFWLKDYQKATEFWNGVKEEVRRRDSTLYHYLNSQIALYQHKRDDAKKELQKALRGNPDSQKIKAALKELKDHDTQK